MLSEATSRFLPFSTFPPLEAVAASWQSAWFDVAPPPGVKRRQLLSPANCYKTFRSLSFMQLASASMLPSQYELGSHNDVPISSGSWHVGAVYNLPSMAREPPAVHLIVPFLLNTFILSEVAALNN